MALASKTGRRLNAAMTRSLSDDPVKLRNELLGLRRRVHAIEKKLIELERRDESEPVLVGDELRVAVELAKAAADAPVDALVGPEAPAEAWGAF